VTEYALNIYRDVKQPTINQSMDRVCNIY